MKTCIITGATSGIGRATAIDLSKLKDYDNIIILGRNEKELIPKILWIIIKIYHIKF